MTRINVIPPTELHDKHLMAEYHEITRVYSLVRKLHQSGRKVNIPKHYVLGTGHVTFFYDKLQYISNRYLLLAHELKRRGKNINPIDISLLSQDIPEKYFNDYVPTEHAKLTNRERIQIRLSTMKNA